MELKKYSSYDEIEKDLEILKLQKQINYHKLVLSVQQTAEVLTPRKVVSNVFNSYKEYFSENYFSIIKSIFPFIIGWFINKKRD